MPGLTPGEERVMDLWDAGLSTTAIGRALALPQDRIIRTVSYYHDSGDHTRERSAMARASDQLATAIQQARAA